MTQELMSNFGVNAFALGNLIAFYYYAYTPMQLPVGIMMDKYGPRNLLALAALICAIGSYLFAHSNFYMAHWGRLMVGFGSAFAFVGVLKLATIWLPPQRFAMVAGLATTLGMVGAMLGDISLARLVQMIGWQMTVLLSAIVGFLLALIIWQIIPSKAEQQNTHHTSITYPQLFRQISQLLKNPQMWLIGLVGFLLYLPTSAFSELWAIPYLERTYTLSKASAADITSMSFLGWAVGGPLMGWMSDKLQMRRLPMVCGAVIALIIISVILYLPQFSQHHLSLLFFVFGVFSSVQIIAFAMASDINLKALAGSALAVTNMIVMLGGVLFQPLIGKFLDILASKRHTLLTYTWQNYSTSDFQQALTLLPVGIFLSLILLFFIKKKPACS